MKSEPVLPLATINAEPRWMMWLSLVVLLIGLHLVIGPKITLSQWHVERRGNTALDEAIQWKKGTMALSYDYREDANIDGKTYNVVGYAFVLLSLIGTSLGSLLFATSPDQFPPALYIAFIALPLPLLGFWAFREVTGSSPWSAVLTTYLIAGTALVPILVVCSAGDLYYTNHAIAISGLLLFGGDLLGQRRIWPAVIGLWLAAWSRQMTCFYAVTLLYVAFAHKPQVPDVIAGSSTSPSQRFGRRRNILLACLGVAIAAALPLTLNAIKFGNPFDHGYEYLYLNGRNDPIANRANQAFMSVKYWPMHLPSLTYAYPTPDIRKGELYLETSEEGASIWLTNPLLLAIFFTACKWWKDRVRRWLMLCSFAVLVGLMSYHTTGAQLAGYYRYSLDYTPLWLLVIAPYLLTPRGKPLLVACLAYSVLYFNTLR